MKRYIKANSQKPELTDVYTEWTDIDNGIKFTVYSADDDILFESVYDFSDVDPDAIYDSAIEMAILSLSQKYTVSDQAIEELKASIK